MDVLTTPPPALRALLADLRREIREQCPDLAVRITYAPSQHFDAFVEVYLDTQPNQLSPAFRDALFNRTGGHALFTVELLREIHGSVLQDRVRAAQLEVLRSRFSSSRSSLVSRSRQSTSNIASSTAVQRLQMAAPISFQQA